MPIAKAAANPVKIVSASNMGFIMLGAMKVMAKKP